MKEATGEGSMTVITIVIIVALGVAAAVIVGLFLNQSASEANNISSSSIKDNIASCKDGESLEYNATSQQWECK